MVSFVPEKTQNPERVAQISELRKKLYADLEELQDLIAAKPECIAEATLAKRELQSARHWLGECLSYYETEYRVTDNPNDAGSESKSAGEGGTDAAE